MQGIHIRLQVESGNLDSEPAYVNVEKSTQRSTIQIW